MYPHAEADQIPLRLGTLGPPIWCCNASSSRRVTSLETLAPGGPCAVSGEEILLADRLYGLRVQGKLMLEGGLQRGSVHPLPIMQQGILPGNGQALIPHFNRNSIAGKQSVQVGLGSAKCRFDTSDHQESGSFP